MQIHHLDVARTERFELDPEHGVVRKKESAIRRSTVDQIVWASKTYPVQPDCSFNVPAEVATFYLTRPGWHAGPSPFADDARNSDEPPVRKTRATASA